ncbi:MAG: hypothetical protein SV775_01970 [Thermodesulfobacteriota bacterium]|nr:hypothetical protein [Thermodesulfobacteriota bacterium]
MISDEKGINFFKGIVHDQYYILIREDYGSDGFKRLTLLTDAINKIYRHLNFSSFSKIIIYSAFEPASFLKNIPNANPVRYKLFQNLSQLSGDHLTIEVRENLDLYVSSEFIPDVGNIKKNAIVYQWENFKEVILGKTEQRTLRKNPYADSYFAIPTYKELEVALENYKVRFARISYCPYLKDIWFNNNRIYFKAGPEDLMRDSLLYFLYSQLRDAEVRPEQNMDASHPVDIKITWTLTNRLAVIEIKWLGRSLNNSGDRITQNYTQARAVSGAGQLKDYLDSNKLFAPDKITIGYLVVFDGRRRRTDPIIDSISLDNADYYKNREIDYNPDYSIARADFAEPMRFFMEANYTV